MERESWQKELEDFNNGVQEILSARRAEKARRVVVFEPIPVIGKTYHA